MIEIFQEKQSFPAIKYVLISVFKFLSVIIETNRAISIQLASLLMRGQSASLASHLKLGVRWRLAGRTNNDLHNITRIQMGFNHIITKSLRSLHTRRLETRRLEWLLVIQLARCSSNWERVTIFGLGCSSHIFIDASDIAREVKSNGIVRFTIGLYIVKDQLNHNVGEWSLRRSSYGTSSAFSLFLSLSLSLAKDVLSRGALRISLTRHPRSTWLPLTRAASPNLAVYIIACISPTAVDTS